MLHDVSFVLEFAAMYFPDMTPGMMTHVMNLTRNCAKEVRSGANKERMRRRRERTRLAQT